MKNEKERERKLERLCWEKKENVRKNSLG